MNISRLYETASTDRVLIGLGLALAEAKMEPALIRSRIKPFTPQANRPYIERIRDLDREILRFEDQLCTIRSKTAVEAGGVGAA